MDGRATVDLRDVHASTATMCWTSVPDASDEKLKPMIDSVALASSNTNLVMRKRGAGAYAEPPAKQLLVVFVIVKPIASEPGCLP
jgi:hypothetical protein